MPLEDKMKKHENAIYTAAYAAAAAGVPGTFVPVLDVAAVGTAWAGMMVAIANNAKRKMDRDTALKLAMAILSGAAAYLAGTKLITFLLHFIPGAGSIAALGINCLLNFLYTFRLGRLMALQMEKPDFDTGDFASIIPEITTMVFAMPSVAEIRETWRDYHEHKET